MLLNFKGRKRPSKGNKNGKHHHAPPSFKEGIL